MRRAEWITVVYFSLVIGVAMVKRQPSTARALAIAFGFAGILLTTSAVAAGSWVRDWLPAFIMVVAYRQAGFLFQGPNLRLQSALASIDDKIIARFKWIGRYPRLTAVLDAYFEAVYFLCYPLVPAGLLALYSQPSRAGYYWLVVLPAGYLCYAMVPFLPTLPPRLLQPNVQVSKPDNVVREANITILRYVSIRANTFPSAHVSASLAVALVVLRFEPWIGALFLFIALSIAVACVAQRYHYAADAVLGALLALVIFAAVEAK
jgi:hypothetical protein